MKAVLRERLLERLLLLPGLIDLYVQQQGSFVEQCLQWLKQSETALEPMRSPLVSRLATLRVQLMAMEDGLLCEQVESSARSSRKSRRALAAYVLQSAELALRDELMVIDQRFDELRDKLAQ